MNNEKLKDLLEQKYYEYNTYSFIETDPIQIPYSFNKKEDIEIAGFLTATIAWGNRKMIINNAKRIINIMSNAPHDFILNASRKEISSINNFVHRTFNSSDLQYFLKALQYIYKYKGGLESIFLEGYKKNNTVKSAIIYFRKVFFSLEEIPAHATKHVSCVGRGSAAKRINMFLMWLVRSEGIHFGLWKEIPTNDLMLPLDVHSGNAARALGLLTRKQNDWKAVEEVTAKLRLFDANDPVKYDFSLFGLDINERNEIT